VDALDPAQHLGLPSNCDKAWAGWPCDEEIEKYRTEFSMTSDMKKRKEIATNLQLRALKYLPYVVIGQFWNFRAHSAALRDIPSAPVQVYYGIKKGK
jgi:peptide/nickel transport system substrate-binding protein